MTNNNNNAAAVTLTDAERLLSPAEAAVKLAGQPDRMAAYILHLQAKAGKAKAKGKRKPSGPVEYSLGEYKGNAMVQVRGHGGKPFNKGVKGVRRILDNAGVVKALMRKADESPEVKAGMDALGANFYVASMVFEHEAGIRKLLAEHDAKQAAAQG